MRDVQYSPEPLSPMSTTMIVSSFELAIVFSIPLLNFTSADKLLGGAFVLLLPEKSRNFSSAYDRLLGISKYAMMGKVVYSDSSNSSILVSIHIDASSIGHMKWSNTYTLFIREINAASTLSTIAWLHNEYVDLKRKRSLQC